MKKTKALTVTQQPENEIVVGSAPNTTPIVQQAINPLWAQPGTTQIVDESDVKGAMREINLDEKEHNSRMSTIDMRTRLTGAEITGMLQVDFLVDMDFLTNKAGHFTRQAKRLKVSQNGQGRKEMVDIANGIRDQQGQKGYFGKLWDSVRGKQ